MDKFEMEMMNAVDVALNLRDVTPGEAEALGGTPEEFMVLECLKHPDIMPKPVYLRKTGDGENDVVLTPLPQEFQPK
jgi:hypothetical protein